MPLNHVCQDWLTSRCPQPCNVCCVAEKKIVNFEVEWDPKVDLIEFPQGVGLVPRATIKGDEEGIGRVTVEVVYDPSLRRLTAERVSVERASIGTEVTGVTLRAVRVQDYVRWAGQHMAFMQGAYDGHSTANSIALVGANRGFDSAAMESLVSDIDKATPGFLPVIAARLYILASILTMPPLKMVSDYLNVSQSTATRLVARARAERYIPPNA